MERKEGFYWVKFIDSDWEIAYYDLNRNVWQCVATPYDYFNTDFAEIDENIIQRP